MFFKMTRMWLFIHCKKKKELQLMGSQIQTFSGCYPGPGSSGSPVIQARWDTWSFLVSSGSSLGSPPSWMCLWGVFKGKIKRVYKSKCVSRCWEAPLHMCKQFYKAFSPEGGLWYQPISMGLNQYHVSSITDPALCGPTTCKGRNGDWVSFHTHSW